MLYQSNLFQNTTGLWHYPPINKKIFKSQVSFKLEFCLKLNWAFYYLLWIKLNADDKSGIRKSSSISQKLSNWLEQEPKVQGHIQGN